MNYDYYKVSFKLIRPMLSTNPCTSISHEHVISKSKKEIAKANKLMGKFNKALDKYVGSNLAEEKIVAELQGIIRAYLELTGSSGEIPSEVPAMLEFAKELEEKFDEMCKENAEQKSTVFLRNKDGFPIISTHMILGNLKENLKIMVNSAAADDKKSGKFILKSKVSIGEVMALDVKAIEQFMTPSNDIMRKEDGSRDLCERPATKEVMGKKESIIVISEQLPEGTEFGCTLRVRHDSPINQENLHRLLDLGKNNGFGAWRGSGNMGAYCYKLELLPDYIEDYGDWL